MSAPHDRSDAPFAELDATRLAASFYAQPVLVLARALVGRILVHVSGDGLCAGRIVETEAYRGPEDLAAHSARGRRTRRTEAMFGPPGRVYMFQVYGTHWAFNVVAGTEGQPHAVLVRALEPVVGIDVMARRRGLPASSRELTNGPGKLCAALGLDRRHYGAELSSEAVFLSGGLAPARIGRSPRIRVDYARSWAAKPWRFYERGNRYVSVPPRD